MSDSLGDQDLGFTPEHYPAGTHLCMMYNVEAERRSVVHPFVLSGLEDGDTVNYLADALPTEYVKRALDDRSAITLPKDELRRLKIFDALQTLCPTGEFKVYDVLERFRQLYVMSRAEGASGCRVTGDASWWLSDISGPDDGVLFESLINSLNRSTPITVLCGYDTELFDGTTLFEVLSVHPFMVVHGQVMRNPYFVGPEQFLAAQEDPELLKTSSTESVLGQLLLVEQVLTGLPDELRMAEFARAALMRIPGVRDIHVVLTTLIIPPDDRWESIRQRCSDAAKNPGSLDVTAIRRETDATVFVMRSTSRLFGAVVVEVDDAESFAPYEDFLANIVNAVAIAQDSWHDRAESRAWSDRVENLEQRLWRVSHELEGAGVTSHPLGAFDLYARPEVSELSERQLIVLTRLLRGERVSNIADALFVSQSTVRNHLSYIFQKFRVNSQQELLDLFRNSPAQ